MTFSSLHASLLALAVFSVPGTALAAPAGPEAPMVLAQADTAAETQDVEAVRKFLAKTSDVSQMDAEKLRQRLKRAERLSQQEGLPADLQSALQQRIAALESELAKRGQSSTSASSTPSAPASEDDAQTETQAQAEAGQGDSASGTGAASAGEVAAFLKSVRPAADLSDKDLRRQVKRAAQLAKSEGISKEQRKALRKVMREGRAKPKGEAAGSAAGSNAGQPQPEQGGEATDSESAGGSSGVGSGSGAEPPQPQGQVNPALEQQAQAMLKDNADVRAMKQPELRTRLTAMRDLLASGQLSPATEEALRAKLANERQVLRNQVSTSGAGSSSGSSGAGSSNGSNSGGSSSGSTPPKGSTGSSGSTPPRGNGGSNGPDIDITIVLGDTRPPNDLRDDELVRRIDVYRTVVVDERYSAIERERWRRQMERDRLFLRQRMLEERRQREAELRAGGAAVMIDVEDDYVPGRRPPPPSVFAAEVADDELADVLAAPPRRKIDRRYTVEEIEQSPDARDAVARIEIDTVHFGFGESFLREEEIDKLDRIARVLERILARQPDEVFLLEGHTDAVGAPEANLELSRERARAVKDALVTYYVIPADNLKTVGLGERYLKIPTEQPEAENRRVSLARITPLVGQAD